LMEGYHQERLRWMSLLLVSMVANAFCNVLWRWDFASFIGSRKIFCLCPLMYLFCVAVPFGHASPCPPPSVPNKVWLHTVFSRSRQKVWTKKNKQFTVWTTTTSSPTINLFKQLKGIVRRKLRWVKSAFNR
jgi:hypothetical protein